MKSHDGIWTITKGIFKGHPTLRYKLSLISHCGGFWLAKLPIRVSQRKLGQCCTEPWLLHYSELVYLFGGVDSCDCNIPLSELVVGHGCIVWVEITLLNIIEPTTFHSYVVLYSNYIVYSKWYMYLFSYACMYGLFCISMCESYLNVLLV